VWLGGDTGQVEARGGELGHAGGSAARPL
jgi:hypothetical protein